MGPVAARLATLLDAFSPWEGISLTYRQFAAELGRPVTEAAIKKWPQRKNFPVEIARLIVARARQRGITGVTLDWVLLGDGPGPVADRGLAQSRNRFSVEETPTSNSHPESDLGTSPYAPGPDGQLPAAITAALRSDLSHNEFGQWSSVEVQRTVLWALKDLARRLRVLRFDMGQTFELTDAWAATIGLPARPGAGASEAGGPRRPNPGQRPG